MLPSRKLVKRKIIREIQQKLCALALGLFIQLHSRVRFKYIDIHSDGTLRYLYE